MAKDNANLHQAKRLKNDELTPAQRAKKKWAEKHRIPDEFYLRELRQSTDGYVPIKGCEQYEINEGGDVYFKGDCSGKKRRKSQFVTKTLLKTGYYKVAIDRKQFLLHRLLAEAFIPNPYNKPEIDHIDGNPQNNSLDNLRWVNHKENLNNPISVKREIYSHTGLVSNIKGRKKIWVDKENKVYKMI